MQSTTAAATAAKLLFLLTLAAFISCISLVFSLNTFRPVF
jgi:uncharacterized membrane protein YtjA (UPF0391 family)